MREPLEKLLFRLILVTLAAFGASGFFYLMRRLIVGRFISG